MSHPLHQPVTPRNAFLHPHAMAPGQDEGQDTPGLAVPEVTPEQIAVMRQLSHGQLLKMIDDRAFDHSHPVDEYAPVGNPGPQQTLTVQADYDMPERITGVFVIIPVGATAASLQLGTRTLQLYSGAALATPLIPEIPATGIILNSDDPRILTLTGAITSQPYVGLTGFALTRGQFS